MGIYDDKGTFLGTKLVPKKVTATGTEADLELVANEIRGAMLPASRPQLEMWIAELSVIAPSRADDEMTTMLKIEAYGRRLEDYPADIVRHAMLGKTWRFFPSWFDLERDLREMLRERQAMLHGCTTARQAQRYDEPRDPRVTAQRANEMCAERGYTPKRFGGDA